MPIRLIAHRYTPKRIRYADSASGPRLPGAVHHCMAHLSAKGEQPPVSGRELRWVVLLLAYLKRQLGPSDDRIINSYIFQE